MHRPLIAYPGDFGTCSASFQDVVNMYFFFQQKKSNLRSKKRLILNYQMIGGAWIEH